MKLSKPFLASIFVIACGACFTLEIISDYNAEKEQPVMDFSRLPDFTNSAIRFTGNKLVLWSFERGHAWHVSYSWCHKHGVSTNGLICNCGGY